MKIPQLRKQEEEKTCHDYTWEDNYSWIHQDDCLDILKDKNKLNPEVKKYLEEENHFTEKNMEETKPIQKTLFKENNLFLKDNHYFLKKIIFCKKTHFL